VNPFVEHHQQSIRFQYSCFDRMLLNAIVQPMQQPARIVGFLDKRRDVPSITKDYFRRVSDEYQTTALSDGWQQGSAFTSSSPQRVLSGTLGRTVLSALRLAIRDSSDPEEPRGRAYCGQSADV
jgi:hypothetical protein